MNQMAAAHLASQGQDGSSPQQQQKPYEPQLPPGLAFNAGKTGAEILADLNKHPLFMTELEENDDVAALQALAYDGTPLENATNFKEQGNECFAARKWADAREFYGKGIAILAAEEGRRAKGLPSVQTETHEGSSDEPAEVERERALLEVLYVNRAACQLELGNYRSCTADCAGAIRLNGGNVKAYYRSARALLALGKVEEAEDACVRGLAVDGGNKALQKLRGDIERKKSEVEERRRKEEERVAKERREEMVLAAAIKARGIRMRRTEKPPEMEDAKVRLVPDPADPTSSLTFPTVLLYPVHLESDFIKAFGEAETLDQHLRYVFPLPWDREGAYTVNGVECYVETVGGGLAKIGRKVPLLKMLAGGNVEIVDELVKIFVVPKAQAESWVKEHKAKRAAENKS
ncbi:TPR-like protein [Coniochaeta hoffmannii]|uniref:TPR-like protein n=1 Tax=Coniochaeta hoffmannii TaxID=91930 RepID=A0AA38VES5_9PEZI|nr:TPR-like protein [Coniochaeta hoffmannii]